MPMPTYEEFIDPLLRLVNRTGPIKKRDYEDQLADIMDLGDDERTELLPSGKQHKFRHRIGWAATHLRKAGLIESPVKATIVITERGRSVIDENPSVVDVKYLRRFPEHLAFVSHKSPSGKAPTSNQDANEDLPPLERLGDAYNEYRESLASDLLDLIMQSPPDFFERLVVEVLVAMGYGGTLKDAGQAVGKSGDGGIDGVIKEDRLGLEFIYIQAKRWDGTIQRPQLQAFAGALMERNARKGVFITTSDFSSGAKSFASSISTNIVLINGEELADLMIEYGVGVIDEQTYRVKRVDPEYFGE